MEAGVACSGGRAGGRPRTAPCALVSGLWGVGGGWRWLWAHYLTPPSLVGSWHGQGWSVLVSLPWDCGPSSLCWGQSWVPCVPNPGRCSPCLCPDRAVPSGWPCRLVGGGCCGQGADLSLSAARPAINSRRGGQEVVSPGTWALLLPRRSLASCWDWRPGRPGWPCGLAVCPSALAASLCPSPRPASELCWVPLGVWWWQGRLWRGLCL